MPIEFLDIDVLVEGHGGEPRVRVLDSPAGQTASQPFISPFRELELENFLLRVGQPRSNRRALAIPANAARALHEAKDVGGRLLQALFPGPALTCLVASLAHARAQEKGLRIRLRLSDSPELAEYPWEFLYDASVDRFLCLSAQTPVVRYLELPEAPKPLEVQSPLRVLVVVAKPTDVPELDVEREWANLEGAMAGLVEQRLVSLHRLPAASMRELGRALLTEEYHVLHFIGHGGYDESGEQGVLVFEDAEGRSRLVPADELGAHLHDHRPMGLVLLNSCEGARSGRTDPFAGTAQTLVQQGLGAVIAMQFEISDTAAIAFSQTFYESISVGYAVDAAVAEGRKAVLSLPNPIEWATPVLYLRAPDARIFDVSVKPAVDVVPPSPGLPDDRQPLVDEEKTLPPQPWWRQRRVMIAGAVAIALAIALGIVAVRGGGDDGPGVVTATIEVPADRAWTDSGIEIFSGDSLEISASGTILHDDSNPLSRVGPDGAGPEAEPALNEPGNGVFLYPPGHGGLIGRISDGGKVFGIGQSMSDVPSVNGPLHLGINDFGGGQPEAGVANNAGLFVVTIRVTRSE